MTSGYISPINLTSEMDPFKRTFAGFYPAVSRILIEAIELGRNYLTYIEIGEKLRKIKDEQNNSPFQTIEDQRIKMYLSPSNLSLLDVKYTIKPDVDGIRIIKTE